MAKKEIYDVIISCDPGVTGGISIVGKRLKSCMFPMPVVKTVVNKKKKKKYDVNAILDIFKKYKGKKVLFVQEKIHSMPGEGSVSSFGFGYNSGLTKGICLGMGFDVVEVSPIIWKKAFPELTTPEMRVKKAEIKDLRVISKTLKDKGAKKQNKKQVDRLGRQIKSAAKTAARELVSKKYPQFADVLQKKNTDGMAESFLIALYGRQKQNELVQKS